MSFTPNVTQLIEKQISTKVINGFWKVEDIETDCDDRKLNFENRFTDPNHKQKKKTEENSSIPTALKTDIGQRSGKTSTKIKVNKGSKGVNETSLKNEVHDDNTNIHSTVKMKTEDEVDFFDSDEEYLETHGFRFDEYDVHDEFLETTDFRGGRYSEGIDRFKNLPVYRRSIQEFANANNFEIYDLIPDGNCMFRALSDQFMINGRLGYTAESLRSAAIEYLRTHPYKDHGHHIQSFLCKETWENYLERMSKTKEWGDHIILQALVDAFNLHIAIFNVFEDDVRHTILQPEVDIKRKQMQVFLGHVGEFHYLSLRPCNWTALWPYKSLMYRTTACSHQNTSSARLAIVRKKFTELKANEMLSEDEFTDMIDIDNDNKSANSTNPVTDTHVTVRHDQFFETYALNETELQDADEKPEQSVIDPMHIDVVTGIPLLHLSYVFKQLLPGNMILPYTSDGPLVFIFSDIVAYLVGSRPVGMDVYLTDISKGQRKRAFYNNCNKFKCKAAILSPSAIVRHLKTDEDFHSASTFYVDSSSTHAGYCHVLMVLNGVDMDKHNVVQRENKTYLTGNKIFHRDFLPTNILITYDGLKCATFPPEAQEWIDRKRKFSFPSQWLFQTILRQKCTLIKKAHPYSSDPEIEWKYDFSPADQTIFTIGLSSEQLEGFFIVKVLIDNVSFHLQKKLKLKHLKAVFFNALEEIPNEMWTTNFGGCILFVISSMVACLKSSYLPHYFMPSINLIACFSAQEINALCVNIQSIRMFPLFVLKITAESHGYTYAQKLIKMVLKDCRSFRHNKDLMTLFTDSFMPATLGVMRVFTKLGFYETAFQQLTNLYEEMRLVKIPADSNDIPNFVEVFEIALGSFRQKSTRVIFAMLFEKYFKTSVLCKVIDERSTFARDILSWKPHSEIEWMEIPSEKVSDLSTLAEYFFSCSLKEFKKRNSKLATATLETAITCLQRCIKMNTISTDNIDDEQLKEEIVSQMETNLLNLKNRLKVYYIWIWNVTKLYLTLEPLIDHMNDIETLCLELPEMAAIVGSMFRYLNRRDKAMKYWEKAGIRKGRRAL